MSSLPFEFLVLDELAEYIEQRRFSPVDVVYTGRAVDPSTTEPLTISLIPSGGDPQLDPTDETVPFQLTARGVGAYAAASSCYDGIGGKELRLRSGRWVLVTAMQSSPALVSEEETGWRVSQNYLLRYETTE